MKHAHQIIKRPLLTEKSTFNADVAKRFAFEVAVNARKDEIKQAVQDLYKVRVVSVNTVIRQARTRITRFGRIKGRVTKKAIVRLHPSDTIEIV